MVKTMIYGSSTKYDLPEGYTEHLKYKGQLVAILNNKVVAHGDDLAALHQHVRDKYGEPGVVEYVAKDDDPDIILRI